MNRITEQNFKLEEFLDDRKYFYISNEITQETVFVEIDSFMELADFYSNNPQYDGLYLSFLEERLKTLNKNFKKNGHKHTYRTTRTIRLYQTIVHYELFRHHFLRERLNIVPLEKVESIKSNLLQILEKTDSRSRVKTN